MIKNPCQQNLLKVFPCNHRPPHDRHAPSPRETQSSHLLSKQRPHDHIQNVLETDPLSDVLSAGPFQNTKCSIGLSSRLYSALYTTRCRVHRREASIPADGLAPHREDRDFPRDVHPRLPAEVGVERCDRRDLDGGVPYRLFSTTCIGTVRSSLTSRRTRCWNMSTRLFRSYTFGMMFSPRRHLTRRFSTLEIVMPNFATYQTSGMSSVHSRKPRGGSSAAGW